jgi:exopolysaccharide biosynthesis glucuronosyltransferase PssE
VILLTVGSVFPFDRLVTAVDELVGRGAIEERVIAQVGTGGVRPRHMESVEVLDKPSFDALLARARGLIGHAGMGTITMALERGTPLLVMPRRKEFGELVNDHQLATARRFEAEHQVLVAYEPADLAAKLPLLATFVPAPRVAHADRVARRIGTFLAQISPPPRRRAG